MLNHVKTEGAGRWIATPAHNRAMIAFIIGLGIAAGLFPGAGTPAFAQGAPLITNIGPFATRAELGWQGGTAPFIVQRKLSLLDSAWMNLYTTSNRSVTVARDLDTAFYRLQSQTTNVVLPFTVQMAGANEMPTPVASPGIGKGVLALEGSNLTYYITFSGLVANATASHIHGTATPTNSAGVLIGFSVPAATSGTISGTASLTVDQVAALINGMLYVNVHTSVNPGGEIRGQIVPLRIGMNLSAGAEVPSVASSATGAGYLTLLGNTLFYDLSYNGLTGAGTASHIHGPASTTNSTGVLVPLASPTGTSGRISGSVNLTPLQLYYVLSGQTYINMHSTGFSGGEIRGQIFPLQLGATLSGDAEHPSTGSPGTGSAFITITNSVLAWNVVFSGLAGTANNAHIHGPTDPAHDAGVLIGFTAPAASSGTITGITAITSLQLFYLVTGQTYVNIHSTVNPGGEIRGQLYPRN